MNFAEGAYNVLNTPPPQAQLDQLAQEVAQGAAPKKTPWLLYGVLYVAAVYVFRNTRKNRVRGSTRTYRY